MNGEVQPVTSTLMYHKKKTVFLNILTWEGLPRWISEEAKRAVFRSISNALTTNVLQLVTPVIVATQLQMSFSDLHEVHTIFLRAMPRYQGIVAQDCVNVSFNVSFIVSFIVSSNVSSNVSSHVSSNVSSNVSSHVSFNVSSNVYFNICLQHLALLMYLSTCNAAISRYRGTRLC